mmetsp:Transcript_15977/g.53888  ORF Transcript_15977/g.53888 Transcript_15977/m.53888 type:complete len:241 (-) Transcript_15977:392-1114(-)
MVVRAAGDEDVAQRLQLGREGDGVLDDLVLVGLVLWRLRLLQRRRQSRDGVVVRAALEPREDGEVDGGAEAGVVLFRLLGGVWGSSLAVEDHGAARPSERLVRRRRHDVGRVERRRDHAGGDEAGNVRHVGEEPRVVLVGDGLELVVVQKTRIRRRARDDQLGPVQTRVRRQGVVVDQSRRLVEAERERFKEDGRRRNLLLRRLVAVREVAAVRQVQRHDALVRLQQRRVDLEIRRRAAQ